MGGRKDINGPILSCSRLSGDQKGLCPAMSDPGNRDRLCRKTVDELNAEIVDHYQRLGYTAEQIDAIIMAVVEDR